MIWLFLILGVLSMGAIALVAAGFGAPMVEEFDDRPDALVPAAEDLTGGDLRRVRFSLALRGYRMSEVDTLLDRLAAQLEALEAEEDRAKRTPHPTWETELARDDAESAHTSADPASSGSD